MAAVATEAEVQQRVREHQKLVDYMVNRYLKRYYVGSMERDDLISWGMIGLVQAARAWDPTRGTSFPTLACRAIERMIVRGVRREWRPDEARATVSLDASLADDASDEVRERFVDLLPAEDDLEARILASETEVTVRRALDELEPEQRELLQRHYFEEEPVREIAQHLGVTRQAIYLREKLALRQLRQKLQPVFDEPAVAA